jgi:ribose-phosphate pyrophosphokinase
MEKRRRGNDDRTETLNVIGDVKGKIALTVDDEIDTAGSLVNTVSVLIEQGAREVYSCCTHPVLSGPAVKRLSESVIEEITVTNTIPLKPEAMSNPKFKVLSVGNLLAEAIKRIHFNDSVSSLFV